MAVEKIGVEVVGTVGSLATAMNSAVGWIKQVSRANTDGATSAQKAAAVGGAALAIVAGAAVEAGGKAIAMAGDFESANTRLATSAGETRDNLKLVGDGVLKLAGEVGDSTQELESGMYLVESAGFHGQAGLDVLRSAAEGAKAENADLAVVANAVTSALNAYGVKADEAGAKSVTMTSQMIAAVGSGKMTMEELAGSLSAVLPVAAAAKLSFDQVGGAVATMTAQGMSAQQSAQDLAFTIRALQAPNQQAAKEMAQLGISSNDVAQQLGSRGLTGTLELLTKAITDHMGPGGQVLMNAFNQSKTAAADAQTMISKMPASLQALAKQFAAGTITTDAWRKAIKALPVDQADLARAFATTQDNARGFNDLLKSGSPEAQTFNAALEKMVGGATGLNTALMLTGPHMDTFKSNVKAVGDAAKTTGSDVTGWDEIQGTFNQRMSQAHAATDALMISIGQKLLPVASQAAGMFAQATQFLAAHSNMALALAGVVGGILVTAISLWTLTTLKSFTTNQIAMARDIIQGATWVASKISQYTSAAAAAATQAAGAAGRWIYWNGVVLADQIASGARWLAARIANGAAAAASAVASAATTAAAWITANAAMLLATGGIVLAIGLLVAAGVWLYNHWDEVWSGIKNVINTAWQWIDANVLHPIAAGFQWLYDHAIKYYIDLWVLEFDIAKAALRFLYDNVVQPVITGIGHVFGWLIDNVVTPFREGWELEINAVGAVFRWIYDNVIRPVANAIGSVINGIINAFNGVRNVASGIGNLIGSAGHLLGFADGGWVPGSPGQPRLAVVHGGEYVLSADMIAGKVAPSPDLQLSSGLTGAGGAATAAGGGAPVVIQLIVQGTVVSENNLFETFQQRVLTYLQRNSGNGLSGGLA